MDARPLMSHVRAAGVEEERIVPGTPVWDASYPDHIQRYRFARDLVPPGARVLDAGCGVGYGTAEIADGGAADVVAVDIAQEALDLARRHFDRPSITWLRDDCQVLERAGAFAPFDVIINFENIEHLPDPERFVARARQLLRANGTLLTSTPNRLLLNRLRGVAPDERSSNPHHLSELSEVEFRHLLGRYFTDVRIRYQCPTGRARARLRIRSAAGSLRLLPAVRTLRSVVQPRRSARADDPAPPRTLEWEIRSHNRGPDIAWTLIAVCSGLRQAR